MRAPLLAMGVAILVLAGGTAFLSRGHADSSAGQVMAITVSPSAPTATDFVTIRVRGGTPCSNTAITSSHRIVDREISVDIQMHDPEACLTMIGEFEAVERVGFLPTGEYTVRATLDAPCCYPCNSAPCVESVNVTIAAAPLPTCFRDPLGDWNGDRNITAEDALNMLRFQARVDGDVARHYCAWMDVTCDETEDVRDVIAIIQFVAGVPFEQAVGRHCTCPGEGGPILPAPTIPTPTPDRRLCLHG